MSDDCLCGHDRATHTVDGCTGHAGAEPKNQQCNCTEFRSTTTTAPPHAQEDADDNLAVQHGTPGTRHTGR